MSKDEAKALLEHHARSMRTASETKAGLTLSPKACANLARELESALAALAGAA